MDGGEPTAGACVLEEQGGAASLCGGRGTCARHCPHLTSECWHVRPGEAADSLGRDLLRPACSAPSRPASKTSEQPGHPSLWSTGGGGQGGWQAWAGAAGGPGARGGHNRARAGAARHLTPQPTGVCECVCCGWRGVSFSTCSGALGIRWQAWVRGRVGA